MDQSQDHQLATKFNSSEIKSPERSEGDGMESLSISLEKEPLVCNSTSHTSKIICHLESPNSSNVGKATLHVHRSTVKRKEPKFIPHEPYKAAVTPICTTQKSISELRQSKLATHGSYLCGISAKGAGRNEKENSTNEFQSKCRCSELNSPLKEEVNSLKLEKAALEVQLKIQTQVNQDLKKLLVASLGEDMQTKVQFLTEDKTKLAHDIVHYSQKLMEDSEHLEKLSIQCDVWRSKFLASSLMVDELAGWKAVLNHQLDDALNVIKLLFGELEKISKHCINALCYTNSIREKCGCGPPEQYHKASAIDALEIVTKTENAAKLLHEKLCGPDVALSAATDKNAIHNIQMTPGQQLAYQILTNCLSHDLPNQESGISPECHACAFSHLYKGVVPRFHPSTRYEHLTFNCCYQCRGDIKLM